MVRFLSDENFNGDIVRGLFLRRPGLDLLRVQDVGLEQADDPAILTWAASNERIVLTHDRATFPKYVYDRIVAGERTSGVFVVNDRLSIGQVITELLLIDASSETAEWADWILYLPL
jgi:hypothetical protein